METMPYGFEAIILAGGRGTRMEHELPKPLVPVKGKAILSYQLDYLLGSGVVSRVILSLGHRADEIAAFVRAHYPKAPIAYSVEREPLGTAGALRHAFVSAQSDRVLVLNADDVTDIDLRALAAGREHMLCVAHPRLPFGRVHERDGYAAFEEKPLLADWVSCGWYAFNRNGILPILPAKGSLEYDVFPLLKLRLYKHEGFWRTANGKKDIEEFEAAELPAALQRTPHFLS